MTPNLWIFSLLPPHQHSRLVAHFLTCVKFDVFGANNHYKHCSSNNNRGVGCEFPHTSILKMTNSYHSIFSHLLTFWNSQSQWKYGSEFSRGEEEVIQRLLVIIQIWGSKVDKKSNLLDQNQHRVNQITGYQADANFLC